ncbi:MAG: ABC transporter ATP-binding protein [Alphaproteobacteria bacterium]|nr:ABC transporter ATP-binding protein [Alphaproteobacteria bacterium]
MVAVRDLVYDYPTARALFGVSFDIAPGSITALVGPNGAGKTTLMRCLAALETPYSGSVTVDGLDIEEYPRQVHERLGFLQDFFGLYDDLTVRRCLDYHAAARSVPSSQRRDAITRSAQRLGLADRLDQRAGTLSRGLRQRLAIAQAIIHRPSLLLLDEPASGLDPEARQELSRLLLTLQGEGMTLVVSSHILAELEDYSTHMMIMHQGRITEHSAIGDMAEAAATPMRVALAAPHNGLRAALEGMSGLSGLTVDDRGASFAFVGDDAARADLLRGLIEAGIPVAAFHPEQRSMQDVYLDRLRRDRTGGGEGGS